MTPTHTFKEGDYVTHATLAKWGLGKVLEPLGGGTVRVFFEYEGEKKMRSDFLAPAPKPASHPVLDRIDRLRTVKGFIPFPNMESAFLTKFPQGFSDPAYVENERIYKANASAFLRQHLSRESLLPLIASEDFDSVCKLAKKVVSKTNLIFANESMDLADGIKKGEPERRLFALALADLLHGEGDLGPRFDAFVDALEALDACKWTTATYFIALYNPGQYIFVKPSFIQKAAQAVGLDIGYTTRPGWACYQRIRGLIDYISGQLSKRDLLRPSDLIDVQGFIWTSLT